MRHARILVIEDQRYLGVHRDRDRPDVEENVFGDKVHSHWGTRLWSRGGCALYGCRGRRNCGGFHELCAAIEERDGDAERHQEQWNPNFKLTGTAPSLTEPCWP